MNTITISKTKMHETEQTITIPNNRLLLIGGNGSGKSAILEQIFEEHHNDENKNIIVFSSGQNETFSNVFDSILRHYQRDALYASNIFESHDNFSSYFFDTTWAATLIFFAISLKTEGVTARFCNTQGIAVTDAKLSFDFRVLSGYIKKIRQALDQEARNPEYQSVRKSDFHLRLGRLLEKRYRSDYDFEYPVRKQHFEINRNHARDFFDNSPTLAFNFWAIAFRYNRFCDRNLMLLQFGNHLKLRQLSDGEFQMLLVSALIDLFDGPNTIFLLDELDSHIHYKNVERLWELLGQIRGTVIATSHNADSIVMNPLSSIQLVSRGIVKKNTAFRDLENRFGTLSPIKSYPYRLVAQTSYIALVENRADWRIFKLLARKKMGNLYSKEKIRTIYVVECPSGGDEASFELGKSKRNWVENFLKHTSERSTKQIFMICDRDDTPLKAIGGVRVEGDYKYSAFLGNKNDKSRLAQLLAWRRREIENYLLSSTALTEKGCLEAIHKLIPENDHLVPNNPNDNNEGVANADVKRLINVLYLKDGLDVLDTHERGIDFAKLQAYIDLIPPSEISIDIENMYHYIVNKIQ
jgi:ABC-type cobalamin/Fe3+-siderophores transport system ATPase subunit